MWRRAWLSAPAYFNYMRLSPPNVRADNSTGHSIASLVTRHGILASKGAWSEAQIDTDKHYTYHR